MEKQKIIDIINKIGNKKNNVIPILQEIQKEFKYLPENILRLIAENSEITMAQISSVATFYSDFKLRPVGKHIIKVCIGTACYVKGADDIYKAFKEELNIKEPDDTDNGK